MLLTACCAGAAPAFADASSPAEPTSHSPAEPEPFAATRAQDLKPRIGYGGDRILILAPAALYRLHSESETWTVTTADDGLPPDALVGFGATKEELWISGTGASVSDIRFDDWQYYGPGEGYPGRIIFDIETDEDYAYAATDAGAGRFDRYVLEWETLMEPAGKRLGPTLDVAVGDERVWFALERGVAEYRKGPESFHVDSLLGQFSAPRVLALLQTPAHVWAVTASGLARYDKGLETWTSYAAGVDLPDARVHQVTLRGEDIWLGTDAGLWHYRADSGIWRADDSGDEMPGKRVFAFAVEQDRIWVVTEQAFAVYDQEDARWLDFTTSVPIPPADVRCMDWCGGLLVCLGENRIVYGLPQGETNPSLFTYREHAIERAVAVGAEAPSGWGFGLTKSGFGLRTPSEESLLLKGGVTVYVEDEERSGQQDAEGLGDLASESRIDLTLNGRLRGERTISGFYDNTDPDNEAYQINYRGSRTDVLRNVSAGEIDEQMFNSQLIPACGLRGGWIRGELGARSQTTKRRLVTADAWAGTRRTFPGRDIFYGGSRTATGSLRDIDYTLNTVFSVPVEWEGETLAHASIYHDDADSTSDDANTFHGERAGRDGAWDLLKPHSDYVIGPQGRTLILAAPLGSAEALTAVAQEQAAEQEIDLTGSALRNHYWIAQQPTPGSLTVTIRDSTDSATDAEGTSYLHLFGLDDDDDGWCDPERFSPLTGFLSFPDTLPFPEEVYAEDPASFYTIAYEYRTRLTIFQLGHRNLVSGSERITVDRELLQSNTDYALIPSTGLFVLFEHIVLDDDSIIEVSYMYETEGNDSASGSDSGEGNNDAVYAAQFGLAPDDHLFIGLNGTSWEESPGSQAGTVDLNTRLEWKSEQSFLRMMPEVALSEIESRAGRATAAALQSRYRSFELSASYRNLGTDFVSMEDRRTLLGRLREEARADARVELGSHLQGRLEWTQTRSDRVGSGYGDSGTSGSTDETDSTGTGTGHTSLLIGTVRFLRGGFPNIVLRGGRVTIDAPDGKREKWISRAELELNPDPQKLKPFGIKRLWVRSFFQRGDRKSSGVESGDTTSTGSASADERRVTDHAYFRLNGAAGNPLSWNFILEDQRTHRPAGSGSQNLQRFQRLDATLQTRPHGSCDAYVRWESSRDLFWSDEGESEGFDTERLLLANAHLYPGRIYAPLSPISFRMDLSNTETEKDEPGGDLPGAGSLLKVVSGASQQSQARSGVFEARLQILSWLRLVERWEQVSTELVREGLAGEGRDRSLESRLEMHPQGGLLTLRVTTEESEEGETESTRLLRFHGDWDQTWGHGILTYLSLQARRSKLWDGNVGTRSNLWNPRVRLTLRRDFMRLDASLGISYTVTDSEDISNPATGEKTDGQGLSVTPSISIQPMRILSIKLQYALNHTLPEGTPGSGGSDGREWSTSHDLKLRLTIRV
jgi:hypothetical protein